MANFCSNRVIFYGDKKTRQLLEQLFKGLARQQQKEGGGHLPPFIGKQGSAFYDMEWNDDEEVLYYETRWAPNLDELVQLADYYGCGFECTYKEPMNNLFGRAQYIDGVLNDDRS